MKAIEPETYFSYTRHPCAVDPKVDDRLPDKRRRLGAADEEHRSVCSRSLLVSGGPDRAAVFAALGDETRLLLLSRLCGGQHRSIAELTEGTSLMRQAVTKHLRVLERATAGAWGARAASSSIRSR